MSGFEVAGLTLALFSLVLEGVTNYSSVAEKVKQMKDHRGTLNEFLRELEMERTVFDNIWYTLRIRSGVKVEPNVDPSPEILEAVLSCLPQRSIKSFLSGCQELITILKELKTKFEKYERNLVGKDYVLIWLYH